MTTAMIFKQFFKNKGAQITTELFSIVVGILLALTIDEWVEEFKYKRFNKELISEMYQELDEDIKEIDATIASANDSLKQIEAYIAAIEADPTTPTQSMQMMVTYNRNMFWHNITTKANLALLEQDAEELVSSILSVNVMQDAVQEHYQEIRKFLFSVCEINSSMRIPCQKNKALLIKHLIRLLQAQKLDLLTFKTEYEKHYISVN